MISMIMATNECNSSLSLPADDICLGPRRTKEEFLCRALANAICAAYKHGNEIMELLALFIGLADAFYLDHFKIVAELQMFEDRHVKRVSVARSSMACSSS